MRRALVWLLACGIVSELACGRDAAEHEYYAALAGEEEWASYEERMVHVDRAIALAPERARYWELRSGYQIGLGDLAAAEADLDRAITLADRPYLRFRRGNLRCLRAQPARALEDFDLAIALQPENTQFYGGRALARVAAGRAEEALADADLLVAREPQYPGWLYVRGAVRLALGRAEEARADLDEALRRNPELVYARHARADARERLGDLDGAAADRARAAQTASEQSGCPACLNPFRQG